MVTRRALIASAGAAVALPALAAGTQEEIGLTFGPTTPLYGLSAIAFEKRFFADEGIRPTLLVTDSGIRARQNLLIGDALFAHGDASHPLQLIHRGRPARIVLATQMVASYANHCVGEALYDQGIASLDALARWRRADGGKPIIGVTAIGAGTWMFSTFLFQRRQLGQDVTWVAAGGTATSFIGLKSRQFDAIAAPPSWQMEIERQRYGRTIYDVRAPGAWREDFGGFLPVSTIYALEETIAKRPDLVQRVVNAFIRTMAWIKVTPVEEIYGLVGQKYFATFDAAGARTELTFDRETWPAYDGRLRRGDFDRGGKVWYRPGTEILATRYEDAVDMRFVEAALKMVR